MVTCNKCHIETNLIRLKHGIEPTWSYAPRTRIDFLSYRAPRNDFFSDWVSAHDRFLSQAALKKNRTDFFSDQKSAHTDRLFTGAIVCDNKRWGPIVGWHHFRFFLGLKSVHTYRFFVVSNYEIRSERFYIGAKVSAHEPIFTPIFCRVRWALGGDSLWG